MKKACAILMGLTLIAMAFAALPVEVNAPSTEKITPSKGKVGQTVVIHGSGLKSASTAVKFGSSPASNVEAVNNKTVKLTVPNRNALDPNPVQVTVTVDGVPAAGDLLFFYDPPGPTPLITDFDPTTAEVGMPITIFICGTDFTTPQGRMPAQIFLFGPTTIEGIVVGSATETNFTAEFPATTEKGVYLLIVGFSDGSGANAEGFKVE